MECFKLDSWWALKCKKLKIKMRLSPINQSEFINNYQMYPQKDKAIELEFNLLTKIIVLIIWLANEFLSEDAF